MSCSNELFFQDLTGQRTALMMMMTMKKKRRQRD